MNWNNLKGEYQILVPEAVELKKELRKLAPSPRLLFFRRPLDVIEARLDTLSQSFSTGDSHLANTSIPSHGVADWGTYAAGAQAVWYSRETVRTLIHECYADIHDLRNRLDTQAALLISLVAIVLSAVSIIVDIST
jgi:hypothetical protein